MKKVLFLHGWTNRRPEGHWMRLTAAALRNKGHQVWYPQFPSPDTPDPEEWQELLRQESNMMDEVEGEKICVAHSLGAINWLFGALNDIYQQPFDRVLLVAPADPEMTSQAKDIRGEPLNLDNPDLSLKVYKWTRHLVIVASDNDKWLPRGIDVYTKALKVEPVVIRGAGHFSMEDGWGKWYGLNEWVSSADQSHLNQQFNSP